MEKLSDQERLERHRESVRKYNRKLARENPEKVRAAKRRDRIKHADAYRARARKHAKTQKSKDRVREYMKTYLPAYYLKNGERLRKRAREYAHAHPESFRLARVRYKQNSPEKYRAGVRAGHSRRRARMRGAMVGCKSASKFIRECFLQEVFVCCYCGNIFSTSGMHIDHIVPVSKGGKHEESNLCCSCAKCNMKKGSKLPWEIDPCLF